MPPVRGYLNSSQLVGRWRQRQEEILETLAPELLAEYRKLAELIAAVYTEESKRTHERTEGENPTSEPLPPGKVVGFEGFFPPRPRVPLSTHKSRLIEFFRENKNFPVSRGEIAQRTHIPLGSLSELLGSDEFEQPQKGYWALKVGTTESVTEVSKSTVKRPLKRPLNQPGQEEGTEGESGG